MTDKEINYLMYSPFPKNIKGKEIYNEIQKAIEDSTSSYNEVVVNSGHSKLHFSWSAVAAILPTDICSYSDIVESPELSTLVKAEIYVQSRWFIADNSMDNANKSINCKLEGLQRIESLMEFYQAELDNEISANMNTLYKNVVQKVIETSSVKTLFKYVLSQIQTQRKIKSAHDQDRKKRNTLMANLLMAIFTASSLFKTVIDIINNEFSITNIIIFITIMIIATGTILIDYYNK